MKIRSLQLLNDRLRKLVPEKMEHCCPRRIVPPNGYPNPQSYAGQLCSFLSMPEDHKLTAEWRAAAIEFRERMTPTYFLGNDLLRACLATEAPEAMKIRDIRFPIGAYLLVLSWEIQQEVFQGLLAPFILVHVNENGRVVATGALFAENDEHTPLIASLQMEPDAVVREATGMDEVVLHWGEVSRIDVSKIVQEREPGGDLSPEDEARLSEVRRAMVEGKNKKALLQIKRELEAELKKDEEKINELDAQIVALRYVGTAADENRGIAERAVGRVVAVALKTALALAARPELVGRDELLRPAKIKRGELVRDALWSPIVLGKNYRLVYESDKPHATHGNVRMHWRRGHYRHQRHGLGLAQIKLIWIEPVLVNAPDEHQ